MEKFHVIGVMSGTSLDGIDFAEVFFEEKDSKWSFQLKKCDTVPYSEYWVSKLSNAVNFSEKSLKELDEEYTQYLSNQINTFISKNNIENIDAVCSHGHTILHQPKNGITLQIGNLSKLSELVKQTVVCNFRVADVQLGGQGAPLVPIGDELLFDAYDYCLNLGGFSNVSFKQNNERIAYDICAVNVVLNHYANKLGLPFDFNGENAQKGEISTELLTELNALSFYQKKYPKSLGVEWVVSEVFPVIEKHELSIETILHTYTEHIAFVISEDLKLGAQEKILVTGGGAFNSFLIEKLKKYTDGIVEIPEKKIIEFKEALIFGFLGVLKLQNKVNVLSSVTGAVKDHSSGIIYSN